MPNDAAALSFTATFLKRRSRAPERGSEANTYLFLGVCWWWEADRLLSGK
jgi:hypothetical protein